MKSILRIIVMLVFILACTPGWVNAHGYVARSEPAASETLEQPPEVIRVWFTQQLEGKVSTLELVDAAGQPVPGELQVNEAEAMLALRVPALAPGAYTVYWRVLATDTHVTEGSFGFTVAGPPPEPEPEPEPALAPEPAPEPEPVPAPVPAPEPPPAEPGIRPVVWIGMAGGAVVAAAAWLLRRGGRRKE